MEIELSIVLPVYNVELFLERCLKNIEMQVKNRKNVEVIMVDDGSKDRSIKICEVFCKKNSNFFWYRNLIMGRDSQEIVV